jgi:hypothetical protein
MIRRRAPVEVRVASTVLYAVGGVLLTLALMATGVLLSRPQIDPARQGGTQVLDLVLFFNAALCLLPVDVLVILLGRRLAHGDRWAWFTTLGLCAGVGSLVLLAVLVLQLRLAFAGAVVAVAGGVAALLGTPKARAWVREAELTSD